MEMAVSGHGAYNREGGEIFVDEYLNLLNDGKEEEKEAIAFSGGDEAACVTSTDSSSVLTVVDSCTSSLSGYEHFSGDFANRSVSDVSFSGDLCEPYDQLAELEWMSNIVQDSESFSSDELQKLHRLSGFKPSSPLSSNSKQQSTAAVVAAEETAEPPAGVFPPEAPVPGKARSKRSRVAPCNWSTRLLVLSQPPTTTLSTSLDSSNPNALTPVAQKSPKPTKKKDPPMGPNYAASEGRKCLHCATDKTPQWRTGPLGPKTLCNACGVRYKSGRLVPEYRPAASPTFVLSKHSNSHRKVLELRRQKEIQLQQQQQPRSYVHAGGAVLDGSAGDDYLIHHHIGPDFRQLI